MPLLSQNLLPKPENFRVRDCKFSTKSYLWGCCHTTGFTRGYFRQPGRSGGGNLSAHCSDCVIKLSLSDKPGLVPLLRPYSSPDFESEDEVASGPGYLSPELESEDEVAEETLSLSDKPGLVLLLWP